MFMFFRIERPTTATLRPFAIATSAACCTRWMFEANDATTIRPERSGISCRNASPTSRSEPVIPGRSAFVESPSRRSTPRLPSSASAPTSVFRPSTGVWSSFQSPVWRIRPGRRLDDDRHRVGDRVRDADELEAERRRAGTAPCRGSTSVRTVVAPSPCSSSFDFTSASVSRVPTTSPTSILRRTYGRPPTWSSWPCVRTIARNRRPSR